MKVKLTDEEIDTLSYDDVAYLILKEYKTKMKIQELFKMVIEAMKLPEDLFTEGIGDFFELLLTDKRFIMLKEGYWDLKANHSVKVSLDEDDEDDDDEEFDIEEEEEELEEEEVDYEEDVDEDDDDGLGNLVVIDEDED
ncbi:MAG TPA: DNA-directed RNA polymerase subunit delta [Mollicutes bacterium]|nr:DNA-directed RNA polymerase subunit delta [Mollicutes bacterium]